MMHIILEGVDTSGKSTQIELLKKTFPDAIFTKEPGGSDLGAKIRKILLEEKIVSKNAELLLFLADRAEHYESVIKSNENRYIFSDRGFVSGIAYAISNSSEIDIELLVNLNKFTMQNQMPDLVIVLKTNKELIQERISTKNQDTIEARGVDYLLKVQENMLKVLVRLNINYIEIDSSKQIEEINSIILKEIKYL